MSLVYGSVCFGIEAASVAWEPLGWQPAFFSEVEQFPAAVLAARYKACGNSMAVNVMRWIGERIDLFERLKREGWIP